MSTSTLKTTSPADVVRNIAVAVIVLALVMVIIFAMRYIGERRMEQRRTVQPTPVPALAASETITILTGLADYPELHLTAVPFGDAWLITADDGDQGLCAQRPVTYADLDSCEHIGG